jgi:uncharacterized membrane protein AbrB (regulator of aidB expression)
MQRSAVITLILAVAAYLGYYGFISSTDRAWCAHIATATLLAWIGWRDRRQASSGLALFAATYILIESTQVAVCGALAWGLGTTPDRDLCVAVGGESLYSAAVSLLVAALWTWRGALWPSRQPSQK